MNKFILNFILNATEQITLELESPLDNLDYCCRTNIIWHQQKNIFLLSNDSLYYDMERFSDFLKKALNNELQLHHSITQDIGYLCNEYYQNKHGFILHNFAHGGQDWIGYQYHLWEAYKNNIRLITWLYNNIGGTIIFEITPCYPYLFCEPEDEPNYISYNEWIKTYKPYLIKEIPIDVAQKWLNQTELIVKTIEKNETQWQKKNT